MHGLYYLIHFFHHFVFLSALCLNNVCLRFLRFISFSISSWSLLFSLSFSDWSVERAVAASSQIRGYIHGFPGHLAQASMYMTVTAQSASRCPSGVLLCCLAKPVNHPGVAGIAVRLRSALVAHAPDSVGIGGNLRITIYPVCAT